MFYSFSLPACSEGLVTLINSNTFHRECQILHGVHKIRRGVILATFWQRITDSEIVGIVLLIASEHFAKNPPPRRIGKPSNKNQNMDIWKCGYLENLDIGISGYLDSGQNSLLLHPQSGLLCGAALPGAFSRKNRSLGFCNLKQCFLHSTKTINIHRD